MQGSYRYRNRHLYRSRQGMIFGVCRGVADYLEFPVVWMRVLTLVVVLWTGVIPGIIVYFAAAMLLKFEPILEFDNDDDREFVDACAYSRSAAVYRLKSTYEQLNRRLQRIENRVTSRDYDWERRLNQS